MSKGLQLTNGLTEPNWRRVFSFLDTLSKPAFVQEVTQEMVACSQASKAWNRMAEQSVWQPARAIRFPSLPADSPNLKNTIIERSRAIENRLREMGEIGKAGITLQPHSSKSFPHKFDNRLEWVLNGATLPTARTDEFTAIYPIHGRNNLFALQYGLNRLVICDAATMKPICELNRSGTHEMVPPFHFAHGRLVFRTVARLQTGPVWSIDSVDLGKAELPTRSAQIPMPKCQPIYGFMPIEYRPAFGIVDERVICGLRSPSALHFMIYNLHTLDLLGGLKNEDPGKDIAPQIFKPTNDGDEFQFPIGGKNGTLYIILQNGRKGPVTSNGKIINETEHFFEPNRWSKEPLRLQLWDIRNPKQPKLKVNADSFTNAIAWGPRFCLRRTFDTRGSIHEFRLGYQRLRTLEDDMAVAQERGIGQPIIHENQYNYLAEHQCSLLFHGNIVIELNSRTLQIIDFQKSTVVECQSGKDGRYGYCGLQHPVHLIDGVLRILNPNENRGSASYLIEDFDLLGDFVTPTPKPRLPLPSQPQYQPEPQPQKLEPKEHKATPPVAQPVQAQPQRQPEFTDRKQTPPPGMRQQTAAPTEPQQVAQLQQEPATVVEAPKAAAPKRGSNLKASAAAFVPGGQPRPTAPAPGDIYPAPSAAQRGIQPASQRQFLLQPQKRQGRE